MSFEFIYTSNYAYNFSFFILNFNFFHLSTLKLHVVTVVHYSQPLQQQYAHKLKQDLAPKVLAVSIPLDCFLINCYGYLIILLL